MDLSSAAVTTRSGLHVVDWCFVAVYAFGMMGIGAWYARREKDDSDYFIGDGRMNTTLVGISLFATLFSTISYLSQPGEIIKHGPFILFIFLSIPIAYYVVTRMLIPVYMRHRVVSAYQLLDSSLGPGIRRLGAALFILLRLVWMSVLIFMASSAIAVIIGLPSDQVYWVIAGTGLVAVFYTTLGGLRAVVISDVVQTFILLLGALCTLWIVSWRLGGLSWIPTSWNPHWDVQPIFSFDPHVRVTVIGVIVMNFFWQICTAGGDQLAIQRYMATRDADAARRAFLINSILGVGISLLVATIGFALVGYYTRFPELLPRGESIDSYADQLFPNFIGTQLPIGLSGLVVSALFAAAMSSVDSGINSITAVVLHDFLRGFQKRLPEKKRVLLARWLALGIGLCVVLVASLVGGIPGSFLELTKKTTNLFAGPIFGLFFLAVIYRKSNPLGAWVGTVWGFLTSLTIAYWDSLTGLRPLSFMYIIPPALVVQIGTAIILAKFSLPDSVRTKAVIALILCLMPLAGIILLGLLS